MAISFPSLRSRAPRHRAIDEVARLRHLLTGADALTAGLRLQVMDAEDARDRANARANTLAEADERRVRAEQQMADMVKELVELRQFKANVQSLDVAQLGHRDIAPDDQATMPVPIVVQTPAQAFGQGRAVTDPGRTTWGIRNEQAGVA